MKIQLFDSIAILVVSGLLTSILGYKLGYAVGTLEILKSMLELQVKEMFDDED